MGAECFVSRLRFTLLPWSPKQGLLIAVAGTFFSCSGERGVGVVVKERVGI